MGYCRMFEICIIAPGGQTIHKIQLPEGRSVRIGRAKDAEIRLDDPMVSRHHAVIVPGTTGKWLLRDAGSTHGCFVDGKRVVEATLDHGVEVRIGGALLRVDDVTSRVARELDRILDEDDRQGGPVEVEIIGLDGRRSASLEDTFVPANDGDKSLLGGRMRGLRWPGLRSQKDRG